MSTKLHLRTDGTGRPLVLLVTPGQRHEVTQLELFGVGPVLAAEFLGEIGDIGRFPTKHHFAAHTGTATGCHEPATASRTTPCT